VVCEHRSSRPRQRATLAVVCPSNAVRALDQAIVQEWASLPKGTQEALSATYMRLGLTPPGQSWQ